MEEGFLREALIYLTAAVVAAPLFNRLKLGSVLGYLAAGVVIGPFVLGLIGRAEDAMHFAEFGVVILLFIIGLEMRPALLWSLRAQIFGLGGGQVLLTGAVLAGAALAFGVGLRPAIALGLILALSSTAIVLSTLEERGMRSGAVGRTSFSVLLMQDLAVIPLFALLPLLAPPGAPAPEGAGGMFANAPPWLGALATLAAVTLVVLAGRFLIRPLFRFIAGAGLREAFTAATLLIVVGVTALMQSVGLSPALGAFLAGMVLGDSEYRREIETDIEPFRGLLLGLFFITIGAQLDIPALLDAPLLIAGLVVGLMAVKALLLFGLARLFGSARRDAIGVALALSQGGEFAFVLFGFAGGAGVLSPELTGLLTVVVAISMGLTPLVLLAYDKLPERVDGAPEPEAGEFEDAAPHAIVAGFGRLGQVVGRILIANGYRTVVLESSAAQIDLLRKFGRRVYYGDATRMDLLRAAGADKAKLLVVAIDDRAKAADLVETARQYFPHLRIIARAWDRRHAYELLAKGAHDVERETFEGGLALATIALRSLGLRAHQAHRAAQIFRRHDRNLFRELAPLWNDEERFVLASRESSRVMERVLAEDLEDLGGRIDDGAWDVDSLNRELRGGDSLLPEEAEEDVAASSLGDRTTAAS